MNMAPATEKGKTSETKTAKQKKIEEALKIIEEAATANDSVVIEELVAEKCPNLKEKLTSSRNVIQETFETVKDHTVEAFGKAKETGEEKIKEITETVEKQVQEKPFAFISGATICAFLLGYIFGRRD